MTGENAKVNFMPSEVKEEAEVDEENPWGDDELDRQKHAKPLTELVMSAKGAPFCIAMNGEWGSGKTFFLKRWCAEFSKQGKAIYFNAWKDDFHADPLTAIIGQLWDAFENGVLKNIYDSMKENGQTIIKKAVLSYSGSGLTPDDLKTPAGKTVGNYLKARQNIDVLQKRLRKLAKTTKRQTGLPLVFVVDELDRCRPTFAIELLERVKHVLGVPGVVFVFGVNQKELEKSIKSVYGKIEAEDYLRKSFHVSMTLSRVEASKYCRHLINKHEICDNIKKSVVHKSEYRGGLSSDWPNAIAKGIPAMAGYMDLSLRQIEQAVRMWLIALLRIENAKSVQSYHLEASLAVFILLRIKNRDMYERFFNENCEPQEVINYLLGFLSWEEIDGNKHGNRKSCMINIVWACYFFYTGEEHQEIADELKRASNTEHASELSQIYRYVPQKIVEIQHDGTRQHSIWILSNLMKHAGGFGWHSPPSRQEIARFLEWGDYWRE